MRAIAAVLFVSVVACVSNPPTSSETDYVGYTSTRYPIVLISGLLGFKSVFGIEEYFHGIPAALTADGARVYVVTVNQAGHTDVRVAEIIPQLEAIVAETGAPRLNLIGHSAGALDARYIAATRPDLVASVTSIAGPHMGTPVADALDSPLLLGTGDALLQGAADLLKLASSSPYPNDAAAAMQQMSTAGMRAFNAQFPAALPTTPCGEGAELVDGIRYYSWGGTSTLTNPLDLSDPLLVATSVFMGGPSDGVVGKCSNHLGHVIRDDYNANHLDETNLLFGMVSLLGPDPVSLYRQQANRLQLAGL
jgi:triacylglycerol lipase